MHASADYLQDTPWRVDPSTDVEELDLPWLLNFEWLVISKTYIPGESQNIVKEYFPEENI